MLIVSQNKDIIVNFDRVESIDIVADLDGTGKVPYKIYYETTSKREEIGEYKTKERAKEVLQEIIKTYALTEQYKVEDERTQINLIMEGVLVYEMPKE